MVAGTPITRTTHLPHLPQAHPLPHTHPGHSPSRVRRTPCMTQWWLATESAGRISGCKGRCKGRRVCQTAGERPEPQTPDAARRLCPKSGSQLRKADPVSLPTPTLLVPHPQTLNGPNTRCAGRSSRQQASAITPQIRQVANCCPRASSSTAVRDQDPDETRAGSGSR